MYEKFEKLVEQIEEIKKYAHETHVSGFFESDFVLYDVPEFISWKQSVLFELEKMKKTDFIVNTISIIKHFNGYNDRRDFDELVGALTAINENISNYGERVNNGSIKEKTKMIFISHASADKRFIKPFVELLEDLGLNEEEIICSSVPPYCIPLDGKVYEWLVDKFQNCELHMFFMLSKNYYESHACLNEMGAAWAMKHKWTGILLPEFEFSDIGGCIDATQISIKLDDNDQETLYFRLEELKDNLTDEFQLRKMSNTVWSRKRGDFLNKIETAIQDMKNVEENKEEIVLDKSVSDDLRKSINFDSCVLLVYAADSDDGQIIVSSDLEGKNISTNKFDFIKNRDKKTAARWITAISELVNQGYVKKVNSSIYEVTYIGYNFADQIKKNLDIDTTQDFEIYLDD